MDGSDRLAPEVSDQKGNGALMKIAIASSHLSGSNKAGAGYQVHRFASQLAVRGHAVTVFSQIDSDSGAPYALKLVRARGALEFLRFAWDLRKVDFSAFDVLHAHGNAWFARDRPLPRYIHTYHGSYFAEFLHEPRLKERVKLLALSGFETVSTAVCDEAVAVSDEVRRFLPGITRVIPNGVDLTLFTPGSKKSKTPVVLFVGMLWGRKRGALLVQKFRDEILSKEPRAMLWMVCDEKVEGRGVVWFGRSCGPLLAELYRKAWVVCLPGTHMGMGLPCLEAMASATAVVLTRVPAARELTRNGRCGLLADDEELGPTILRVLQDRRLRERLERAGLERASEFSWDMACARYEEVYRGRCCGTEGGVNEMLFKGAV